MLGLVCCPCLPLEARANRGSCSAFCEQVRGQLRGFLQTERVKYISQDVRDKFAEAVTPEDM